MTPLMKQHFAQMSVRKRKQKYYYHCSSQGKAGELMSNLVNRCNEASQRADEWVKAQGGESYIESQYGLAGGVVFVIFDHNPGDLWKRETDVEVDMSFDAEQLANGAGLYAVNIPDDLDLKPYIKGEQEAQEGTPLALTLERMRLPIVSMNELLDILHPVLRTVTTPDGKQRNLPIVLSETPRFFEYEGWWYVELPFQIDGEGFNEISQKTFALRINQALREESKEA